MAKPEKLKLFHMLEAKHVLKVPRNWVPMFNLVTDGVPSKVLHQTISKQFKKVRNNVQILVRNHVQKLVRNIEQMMYCHTLYLHAINR